LSGSPRDPPHFRLASIQERKTYVGHSRSR
jgi:hypothetical protein